MPFILIEHSIQQFIVDASSGRFVSASIQALREHLDAPNPP